MPKRTPNGRPITDFFSKFTIPQERIPEQDTDDEIVVASPARRATKMSLQPSSRKPSSSPQKSKPHGESSSKRGSGRPRKSNSSSPSKPRQRKSSVEHSRAGGLTPAQRSLRKSSSNLGEIKEDAPPVSSGLTTVPSPSQASPTKLRTLDAVVIPSPREVSDQNNALDRRASSQLSPRESRTGEAADIPSPFRESRHRLPSTQVSRQQQEPTAKTSFSSFSTLTSFSKMSSQSSSRRVVRKGVQAVTNSDSGSLTSSGSDDELADIDSFAPRKVELPSSSKSQKSGGLSSENPSRLDMSSSEEELADLDSWAPRKRRRVTPPRMEKNGGMGEPTTRSTRNNTPIDMQNPKKRPFRLPSPPPTKSYKHSLLNLAKQRAEEAASEKRIAEVEAYVKETEKFEAANDERALEESERKHLAATLAQDSDDEERMLMAMERTEALREKETFYFFTGNLEARVKVEFPVDELESCGLTCIEDTAGRERACTSGFLAVVASRKGLPDSVVNWLRSEILVEPSEELCESYVGILDALAANGHSLTDEAFSLSEIFVGQTFRDAEEHTKEVESPAFPPNINYALKALASLAPTVSPVRRACALAELIFFNNDDHARSDIDLQLNIERAMDSLLESNDEPDLQTVFQETTRQIMHASFISRHMLSRAIATLPASSARLHNLRRKLSLHILLEAPSDEPIIPSSPSTGTLLLTKLKTHPQFHITESANYPALHSLFDLLDISIDAGFSDFSFLSPIQTPQTPSSPQPKSLFTTSTTNTTQTQPAQKSEIAAFNAQIDSLTDQLRRMAGRIRDAGTSHLKRTEAKSALERLAVRLESAVRTRPRPRKGVFESESGEGVGGKSAMEAFLRRGKVVADEGVEGRGLKVEEEREREGDGLKERGGKRRLGKQHKVSWEDGGGRDDAGGGAEADGKTL